jgi:hypothetical protein
MSKRSNKQVGEILTREKEDRKQKEGQEVLDRKIATSTGGFTTYKFCELILDYLAHLKSLEIRIL